MVPYGTWLRTSITDPMFVLCTATFSDLPMENYCMLSYVADPDVYPGFRILTFFHPGFRNPDQQQRGVKKILVVVYLLLQH
jgi:hypothetical protein